MKKILIKWTLILLLAAFTIMAFTGLSFVFGVHSHFLGEVHEITGIIFISLIVIHLITFRKIIRGFLCNRKSSN